MHKVGENMCFDINQWWFNRTEDKVYVCKEKLLGEQKSGLCRNTGCFCSGNEWQTRLARYTTTQAASIAETRIVNRGDLGGGRHIGQCRAQTSLPVERYTNIREPLGSAAWPTGPDWFGAMHHELDVQIQIAREMTLLVEPRFLYRHSIRRHPLSCIWEMVGDTGYGHLDPIYGNAYTQLPVRSAN